MNIEDLQIGDIITNSTGNEIELIITDLSDDFMIQNEVSCLIGNSACKVFRCIY